MTAQEAIKDIRRQLAEIESEDADVTISIESLRMGIKALKKQIPKKPNLEGDGYWNGQLVYDTWICPCCEKGYEVDYEEYDYCPNCGQKIDWGGANE